MAVYLANTLINLEDITTDYSFLNQEETNLVISHVKKHILEVKYKPSLEQWNSAWDDLSKCDAPKYFSPRFMIEDYGIYRYNQKYIKSKYFNLEGKFHDQLLKNIQDKWLSDIDCVVEFGCGTGHNLQKIRNRNNAIKIYGSDWTSSSQKILSRYGIPSWNFDMRICDKKIPKEILECENICFLTIGSMEQLGENWERFLDFMLNFKPKRSIHIEPIIEFYDINNEIDYLAYQYHKKRGYLNGFFNKIINFKQLKFYQRIPFGNIYNEGYNVVELEYE